MKAAGLTQGADVGLAEQGAVAQLDGVGRSDGQVGQKTGQGLGKARRTFGVGRAQRGKLKYQRAALGAQSFHVRADDLFAGKRRVEKQIVATRGPAALFPDPGVRAQAGGLDQKAEVVGHHVGVLREVLRGDRGIVRTVDTDGTEKRVLRVGFQTVAREVCRFRFAVVDQTVPSGKRPRGGSQPHVVRKPLGERARLVVDRRRSDATGGTRGGLGDRLGLSEEELLPDLLSFACHRGHENTIRSERPLRDSRCPM